MWAYSMDLPLRAVEGAGVGQGAADYRPRGSMARALVRWAAADGPTGSVRADGLFGAAAAPPGATGGRTCRVGIESTLEAIAADALGPVRPPPGCGRAPVVGGRP